MTYYDDEPPYLYDRYDRYRRPTPAERSQQEFMEAARRVALDAVPQEEMEAVTFCWDVLRSHGRGPVAVWGPTLVRAALQLDLASSLFPVLEQRLSLLRVLRKSIHRTHAELAGESEWLTASLAALEECRPAFLAGAITEAEWRHRQSLVALAALTSTDSPAKVDLATLPEETLDLSEVRKEAHNKVIEVDRLTGIVIDALNTTDSERGELRTAARRLLTRAAANDPEMFIRKSRDDAFAAGAAAAVAEYNGIPGVSVVARHALAMSTTSSVTHRIDSIIRAADVGRARTTFELPDAVASEWARYAYVLTDTQLQTSTTRALIRLTHEAMVSAWEDGQGDAPPATCATPDQTSAQPTDRAVMRLVQ